MCMQDLGRYGCAHHGLSQGGAMDLHGHCWANRLLENSVRYGTIEITIGMAAFRAESNLQLALAGADMRAEVDGVAVGNWRSFIMKRGETLTLHAAQDGMRAYLAVAGGYQVGSIHGSVSTVVRDQLGMVLNEGDHLSVETVGRVSPRQVSPRFIPTYGDEIELRVIPCYQVKDFSVEALQTLYHSTYTLTQESDRMGARLHGEPIVTPAEGIISEGIALGAIQIPLDGQPIILLNDRQTLGGYPKPGCIARIDLPKLAQARPGTKIRFTPITLKKATRTWQAFCQWFGM